MSNLSPIFIVGTQRSGTTLLRLILNAHSQISIPEEATFLMPLLKRKYFERPISGSELRSFVNYLSLNPQFKLWNYDISSLISSLSQKDTITLRELLDELFSSYSRSQGKKIWGDKTPSFFRKIDILYSLFPNAKFIHIIRDGRDVFDSWRKMDPSKNNAAVVALDWCYKLFTIEKSFVKIPSDKKITIRYEDLLENPEQVVKLLCKLIDIKYESNMLNFYRTSNKYIGSHHSKLIFQPINKYNRFKWKKTLSLNEAESFTLIAKYYLKKYNYEAKYFLKISNFFFILRDILFGLPRRMIQVLQAKRAYDLAFKKGSSVNSIPVGNSPKKNIK